MARRPRVVVDGRVLLGHRTGAGKALAFLLDHLRAGHPEFDYVVLQPKGAVSSWRLRRQLAWEQVELPLRAARAGADVIHVPGGSAAPLARLGALVVTVHDLAPLRDPALLPPGRGRWYWSRWMPLTVRRADRVIVPSSSTRDDVVRLLGVPAHRVHLMPLAVPLDVSSAQPPGAVDAVRQRYRLPPRYVLYVGTIDRRKDYRGLLEATQALDADVALVIAGSVIAGRTDFAVALADLRLEDRVRVLGYVPDDDLVALYRGAAVFVYPSFFEGFGLPVIEAMASGTPVVTYRTTSLPEVAGDAAILLEPPVSPIALAKAIREVMDDPELRRRLVERGRARAAAFDWPTAARLTADVYAAAGRRR